MYVVIFVIGVVDRRHVRSGVVGLMYKDSVILQMDYSLLIFLFWKMFGLEEEKWI